MKFKVSDQVATIKAYEAGKPLKEVKRQYQITNVIKLASNENPMGFSPKVNEAVAIEMKDMNRYPESTAPILCEKLAQKFGVATKNIVVGNEETGLHDQYTNQDNKPIYDILSSFIEQFKPNSILYIREDLSSENMRRNFENGNLTQIDVFTGEPYYRTQFLNNAKELNIPVEFASFGSNGHLIRDCFF